ncbi:translation initiation factor IF-2-like isoform X2 [Falco cherrug]|uniref:translation initiation factor IF-2-like isoform X2 n=1 Tax=Falco cherrug TaxID=345164 RepID=UPI0024791168|nr:translation initiation factor IF-2-like isoform X2 [Falco cherrug]
MAAARPRSRGALKPAAGDPDEPAPLPSHKKAPRCPAFPIGVKVERCACPGCGRGRGPGCCVTLEPRRLPASGERSGRSQHGGAEPGAAVRGRPRRPQPGQPRSASGARTAQRRPSRRAWRGRRKGGLGGPLFNRDAGHRGGRDEPGFLSRLPREIP